MLLLTLPAGPPPASRMRPRFRSADDLVLLASTRRHSRPSNNPKPAQCRASKKGSIAPMGLTWNRRPNQNPIATAAPRPQLPATSCLGASRTPPPQHRMPPSRHPRNLVWGFQSQALISGIFFSSSKFLGSIWKPVSSSRPIIPRAVARSGCQDGRRAYVAGYSVVARPRLDSREHDGMLGVVGMTITRGAR